MRQRGAGIADLPPSIKTCRHETDCTSLSPNLVGRGLLLLLLLFGVRARVNEIEWRLITIEKNPGARDTTVEGVRRRMEK